MTAADWIALAGAALAIGGLIFNAGRTNERIRAAQEENKRQCDGLGRKVNRVIAFLVRSDDLNAEQRREQLSAILEGK